MVRRRRRGFSRGAVIRGRRRAGKRGFTVPGAGDARLVLATRPRGWPRGKASAARGRAARPERVTAGERDGGGPPRGAETGRARGGSLPRCRPRRAERRAVHGFPEPERACASPAPPRTQLDVRLRQARRAARRVRRGGPVGALFFAPDARFDVIRERRELHRGELRQAQDGLQRLSRANVAVEDVLRAGCAGGGHFPRRRASDAPVPERRVNVTRSRAQLASKLVLKRAFQLHRVPHGRAGREGVEAPRHPHRRRCASRFRPADAPGRVPRAADAPTIFESFWIAGSKSGRLLPKRVPRKNANARTRRGRWRRRRSPERAASGARRSMRPSSAKRPRCASSTPRRWSAFRGAW